MIFPAIYDSTLSVKIIPDKPKPYVSCPFAKAITAFTKLSSLLAKTFKLFAYISVPFSIVALTIPFPKTVIPIAPVNPVLSGDDEPALIVKKFPSSFAVTFTSPTFEAAIFSSFKIFTLSPILDMTFESEYVKAAPIP